MPLPTEYEEFLNEYMGSLPKSEQEELKDDEKVALVVFTSAAGALFGPAAAGLTDWWVTGGGKWVGEQIISALPSGWVAQGVFDWVSYVIEPVRAEAIKIDTVIRRAAKESYRRLLEHKDLVPITERTPDYLLWSNIRPLVVEMDPRADHDAFELYVDEIARSNGYDSRVDFPMGLENVSCTFFDWKTCMNMQGGRVKDLAYCTSMRGVPRRLDQAANAQITALQLAEAYDMYRLRHLKAALKEALANTNHVLDNLLSGVRLYDLKVQPPGGVFSKNFQPADSESSSIGWVLGVGAVAGVGYLGWKYAWPMLKKRR